MNDIINKHGVENFTKVGVNMCSFKCETRRYCWSIAYDVGALMCHVLKLRLDYREECGQCTFIPKQNKTNQAGLCPSETCRDKRCLETRSGREVCVKGMDKMACEEAMTLENSFKTHPTEHNGKNDDQRYRIHLNAKLVGACMDGDINRVKCILSYGHSEINVRGPQRKTPVMIAAEKADIDMFDFLVRKGADLSLVDVASNTVLHFACDGGNLEIISYILTQNAVGINSCGEDNWTPAMKAALQGHKDVFDLLVSKGADLSLVDGDRNTILHLACEGGNLDIVKYILKQNTVNINSLGENGWTPAMKAALKGHKDVFNLIVTQGADLSLMQEEGDSILHAACKGGNVKIVNNILSQSTIDINLGGTNMLTPVMVAAYRGHKDVFNMLVTKDADLLIKDGDQNSILHLACKGGNMEIMKHILTYNTMDVNDIGKEGLTPVMLAASEGRKGMFDLLLQNGADLSHEDDNGRNILHMACRGGNMELVTHVLKQNIVEINSRSHDGSSPAMEAAYEGHTNVLKLLRSEGADLSAVNGKSNTILYIALESEHKDTVKYVLSNDFVDIDSRNNDGMTAVMLAVQEGMTDIFHSLVRRGADLSLANSHEWNILHIACDEGNSEIVKYILSENAVNVNDRTDDGMTPVLLAAEHGFQDIFVLLERKGADVSVVDNDDENILHKLSVVGNVDLMQLALIHKNVAQNMNETGAGHRTPVMIAAYCGYKEVFDLLVEKGADLTLVDMNRNNILHLASEGGNADIVKYILENEISVVEINSRSVAVCTPALEAAYADQAEVLKVLKDVFDLLVKNGADLTLVDADGNSILHLPCEGTVDIVKYLLSNNIVDINARGHLNRTPVLIAAVRGNIETFELLMKQGADMLLVDDDESYAQKAVAHGPIW
ncbi:ankyrin-3-like [Haliotis asinina]|uniref:ankyrin-3-like n=1 Tax=Haliotis asinina TaxID=109174 RepID=UPI00353222E9